MTRPLQARATSPKQAQFNLPETQNQPTQKRATSVMWLTLVVFLLWDTWQSPAINLRLEPPLIAAGSGQAVTAGHCSATAMLEK